MPWTAPAGAGRDAGQARTLQAIALANQPHDAAPGPRRRGLFIDCETTGLDHGRDQVIELAMLPFTYAIDGHITEVLRGEARAWRQDPGRPLPPEITRITGLTDADLEGEAIDTAAAAELVAGAHLVVAHNAGFDRPFLEALVPAARDAAWACSQHEVSWDPAVFGIVGRFVPRITVREHPPGQPRGAPRFLIGRRRARVPCLRRHCALRATAALRAYPRRHRRGEKTRPTSGSAAAGSGDAFGGAQTHRSRSVARSSGQTARYRQGNGLQTRRRYARRDLCALNVILGTNLPMTPTWRRPAQ